MRCATVVLQPWMLRSKQGATSFHSGLQIKAGYPRWLKSTCFKVQDAMLDFAYCPQLNAFRCAVQVCDSGVRTMTLESTGASSA